MDFKIMIAGEIASALDIAFGNAPLSADEIAGLLELPPDSAMGDYAFPCFKLARSLRKAPPMIAGELVKVINADFLSRVEAVGGYLNFFIDKALYASSVIGEVLDKGAKYGSSDMGAGKTLCIDYSSINIAKRFHIGHLSTTALGNALYKIYSFLGYKCVGIFASLDPVALDQACVDAVYASKDPGKAALIERMESRHGVHTIETAEKLGLGSREYEIVDLTK